MDNAVESKKAKGVAVPVLNAAAVKEKILAVLDGTKTGADARAEVATALVLGKENILVSVKKSKKSPPKAPTEPAASPALAAPVAPPSGADAVPVRSKEKTAPTTVQKGEFVKYEDGSIWTVAAVSESAATLRCVTGGATNKAGERQTVSPSRAGYTFCESPQKEAVTTEDNPLPPEGGTEDKPMRNARSRSKSSSFEPTKAQIERIKRLRKDGKSFREICEDLGVKTEHPWNTLHKYA